jgi:hypothetical protein
MVADQQDECVVDLASLREAMAKLTDRTIDAHQGPVYWRRVRARLMGVAIHRGELGEDKPRAPLGGVEEVARDSGVRWLVPHRHMSHRTPDLSLSS